MLAGGAARRFGGRPKGLFAIEGTRIADLALGALRGATSEQIIVANDPRAGAWFPGQRIVADAAPGLGPLAGIATGLDAANGAPVVVVAWDMPYVPSALLLALQQEGASAVLPRHGAGRVAEPLCAYYAGSALSACRTLLAAGERRAASLAGALPGARYLAGDALRRLGDPARMFTSVDSPEQLAELGGAAG